MSKPRLLAFLGVGLAAMVLLWTLLFAPPPPLGVPGDVGTAVPDATALTTDAPAPAAAVESEAVIVRDALAQTAQQRTGVRGRVVDGRSGAPLAGVEVVALRRPPDLERIWSRFAGLFRSGLWSEANEPVQVLGRSVTVADGTFEILGLSSGRIFLDGRSATTFIRTPRSVRLAEGEIKSGIELLGAPGGRIEGVVLAPDGLPASGARLNLRPGLNAFMEQLTQRRFRWMEVQADAVGKFEILGVPTGKGYTLSAVHPLMALEEVYGLIVEEGRTTQVTVQGHPGAEIVGRVVNDKGEPVPGAEVALAYMDISRALFSADGREAPLATAADGTFRLSRVAAGRVALVAAAEGLAPSAVMDFVVVDGGVYDEVTLTVGEGKAFSGLVVDENDAPLGGAQIELRPMEATGAADNVIYDLLRIRAVKVTTGLDGRFAASGLTGDRLVLQASKTGYATEVRFGVKLDERDVRIQLVKGATVQGIVVLADGQPVTRFAVEARSRPVRAEAAGSDPSSSPPERRGGPPWGGRRGGTIRLAEGQRFADRSLDGEWQDVIAADGKFMLRGVPPGRITVRAKAEGHTTSADQTIELASGQASESLRFVLEPGFTVRGSVLDEASGAPVADAQVTAHRARGGDDRRDRGPIRVNFELEDFDFLGLSANTGRRSAFTDSQGRFELTGVAPDAYRVVARHPDLAKSAAADIEVKADTPVPDLVLKIGTGGGVEGVVTGAGRAPMADALVVALSVSAGAVKSASTDAQGYYKLDGLTPGQYVLFKSRMEERGFNLAYELLGNMRLSTVTVRRGKLTRHDIHDAAEGTVSVSGIVRDGDQPVQRAMVSALTSDRDGILGVGVRARPTDEQGRYQLVGMKPGTYWFQVTRFLQQPQQVSLSVEIPAGVSEHRVDLELPQSYIGGLVQDGTGQPLRGIQVSAGVLDASASRPEGILGLIMKNAVAQARTDEQGRFKIASVAPGQYRVTASGRGRRNAAGDAKTYGDAIQEGLVVDGRTPIDNIVLTLPSAGAITGSVVDGSGNPVAGAEVLYLRDGEAAASKGSGIEDLFGVQLRPARTGADGRFQLTTVSPGTYRVRADVEGLAPGMADQVVVGEGQTVEVQIRVVKGARLRLRVTNVDGGKLPLANITVLDGAGRPLAQKVSVVSVFRNVMRGQEKKDDSGWHELGDVPPDTYTVIVQQKGFDDLRFTKDIRDGETVAWDLDMVAELERLGRTKK